jgi:hypothetical protein
LYHRSDVFGHGPVQAFLVPGEQLLSLAPENQSLLRSFANGRRAMRRNLKAEAEEVVVCGIRPVKRVDRLERLLEKRARRPGHSNFGPPQRCPIPQPVGQHY